MRGRYPVAIGLPKYHLEPFQEQGLARNVKALPGPLGLTNAGGGIQMLNRAPNPNAAKVYVNWLLSPKAPRRRSRKPPCSTAAASTCRRATPTRSSTRPV